MSSDNPETPSTSRINILGFQQPAESEGKCFSCGFLWLELPSDVEPDYREVDWHKRLGMEKCLDRINTGKVDAETGKEESLHPMLECLLGLRNIHGDIGTEATNHRGDFERAVLVVLKKDIKCSKWQPYNPGKSIQQYYAEVFMQELEKLRQQFQEDWERRQQDFERQLAVRDEVTQLELAKRNEQLQAERDKLVTKITKAGIWIASIFALAQVLTLTKESLLWKIIVGLYHWLTGQ